MFVAFSSLLVVLNQKLMTELTSRATLLGHRLLGLRPHMSPMCHSFVGFCAREIGEKFKDSHFHYELLHLAQTCFRNLPAMLSPSLCVMGISLDFAYVRSEQMRFSPTLLRLVARLTWMTFAALSTLFVTQDHIFVSVCRFIRLLLSGN